MVQIISGGLGKLVGPSVDDGMAIDVVDAGHDALLEFVLSWAKDTNQALASGVIVGSCPVAVVIKCRKRAIGHRSLDAALHRLMMHAKSSSHGKERWLLPIAEQHHCPRHPACRFGPRPRQRSVLQSPLRSSPTRPLAAILP